MSFNVQQQRIINHYREMCNIPSIISDDVVVNLIKQDMIKSGKFYPGFESLVEGAVSARNNGENTGVFGFGFNYQETEQALSNNTEYLTLRPTKEESATLNFLKNILNEAEKTLSEREKEAGGVSAFTNFMFRQIWNSDYSKKNVKKEVKEFEKQLLEIEKASKGEKVYRDFLGNASSVTFKDEFKKLRGVEFDSNKINATMEKSAEVARIKTCYQSIQEVKKLLGYSTSGMYNITHPQEATSAILQAFDVLGVTKGQDKADLIGEIFNELKDHPIMKKYNCNGLTFDKNSNGKYCLYRYIDNKNGFTEAPMDVIQLVVGEIVNRLDKALATGLGIEFDENTSPKELSQLCNETVNKHEEEYQKMFAESFGGKDVKTLSDEFVLKQQQDVATFEAIGNGIGMALMIVPGGVTATSGWLLKGGKFVQTAQKMAKVGAALTKVQQVASPIVMGNMILSPTQLVEQWTSENGFSDEELEEWKTRVVQNTIYMAAGMGASRVAAGCAAKYKTRRLVEVLKSQGKSFDEIQAMIKANPVQFPTEVVEEFSKIAQKGMIGQISAEIAFDVSSTVALNLIMGNGTLSKMEVINSIVFAISGGAFQKQFAPLSTETKIQFLMDNFKDYGITHADAENILKAMDDISIGKGVNGANVKADAEFTKPIELDEVVVEGKAKNQSEIRPAAEKELIEFTGKIKIPKNYSDDIAIMHKQNLLKLAEYDLDLAYTILERGDCLYNERDIQFLIDAVQIDKSKTLDLLSKTRKNSVADRLLNKTKPLFIHFYDVLDIVKIPQEDQVLAMEIVNFAREHNLNVINSIRNVTTLAKIDKNIALKLYKDRGQITGDNVDLYASALKTDKNLTLELIELKDEGGFNLASYQVANIVWATQKAPDFMKNIQNKFNNKELSIKEYYDISNAINLLGADFAYKTIDELTLAQKRILLNEVSSWKHATGRSECIDEMFPCLPKTTDSESIVKLINRLTEELNSKPEKISDSQNAKFNTSIEKLCKTPDSQAIKALIEEFLPEYKMVSNEKVLSNSLSMIKRIINDNNFNKLSESDKKITIISSILSNLKNPNETQLDLAANVYNSALKLGFDEYDSAKIYSIVKSSNLVERFMATNKENIVHKYSDEFDITARENVLNQLAFELKDGNTFELAQLVYSSKEQVGLTRFLDKQLKNKIDAMKADDFVLYQTPMEEYQAKAHKATIIRGNNSYEVMVVNSDEINNFYAVAHSIKGISGLKGDRPENQRIAKMKTLEHITDDKAFCGAYINGENICAIGEGFILIAPNDKFYVASGHDISSTGKNVNQIVNEYFIENDVVGKITARGSETKNQERKMVSRNIKEILGINDEEYIKRLDNIKEQLRGKPLTPDNMRSIDSEFADAYDEFFSRVNDDGTKGQEALLRSGNDWNEVIVSNAKIGGIYTTDLAKISEDMLIFAQENDVPIVVLKEKARTIVPNGKGVNEGKIGNNTTGKTPHTQNPKAMNLPKEFASIIEKRAGDLRKINEIKDTKTFYEEVYNILLEEMGIPKECAPKLDFSQTHENARMSYVDAENTLYVYNLTENRELAVGLIAHELKHFVQFKDEITTYSDNPREGISNLIDAKAEAHAKESGQSFEEAYDDVLGWFLDSDGNLKPHVQKIIDTYDRIDPMSEKGQLVSKYLENESHYIDKTESYSIDGTLKSYEDQITEKEAYEVSDAVATAYNKAVLGNENIIHTKESEIKISSKEAPKTSAPKLPAFVADKANTKFTADDVDKAIEDILKFYKDNADDLRKNFEQKGFFDLGHAQSRVKGEASLRDKIVNYLKKHPNATHLDIWQEIRDCFACRTIIQESDFTKHPEVSKILETGDKKAAVLKAAELQSQEAVNTIKKLIDDNVSGDNKVKAARFTNYVSKDGIPYLSENQLAEIKQYAANKGITLDIVVRIDEVDPKYKEIIQEGGKSTTRSQPSGYTALQMNFITESGAVFEWQYRGEAVNKFAEAEHIAYDARTGKKLSGGDSKLEELYEPIQKLLNEKSMPEDVYNKYNEYLNAYYYHCRLLELGFESTPPKLSDYEIMGYKFDPILEAEGLMKLHDVADALKNDRISTRKAKRIINNFKKGIDEFVPMSKDDFALVLKNMGYDDATIKKVDLKNVSFQSEINAMLVLKETLGEDFERIDPEDLIDMSILCNTYSSTNITKHNIETLKNKLGSDFTNYDYKEILKNYNIEGILKTLHEYQGEEKLSKNVTNLLIWSNERAVKELTPERFEAYVKIINNVNEGFKISERNLELVELLISHPEIKENKPLFDILSHCVNQQGKVGEPEDGVKILISEVEDCVANVSKYKDLKVSDFTKTTLCLLKNVKPENQSNAIKLIQIIESKLKGDYETAISITRYLNKHPKLDFADFARFVETVDFNKLTELVPDFAKYTDTDKISFLDFHYKNGTKEFNAETLSLKGGLTTFLAQNYLGEELGTLLAIFPKTDRNIGTLPKGWFHGVIKTEIVEKNVRFAIDDFRKAVEGCYDDENIYKPATFELGQRLSWTLGKQVDVKYLDYGSFGTGYKISVEGAEPVVLKIYHKRQIPSTKLEHGQRAEIPRGPFLNEHSNNFVHFYFGKVPDNYTKDGFVVTEFLKEGEKPKHNGNYDSNYQITSEDSWQGHNIIAGQIIDYGAVRITPQNDTKIFKFDNLIDKKE